MAPSASQICYDMVYMTGFCKGLYIYLIQVQELLTVYFH